MRIYRSKRRSKKEKNGKDCCKVAKKDNFLLSIKHAKRIKGLSDEDAGKLLKSIFSYVGGDGEEEYNLSERADIIFDYIKEEISEAAEKYEKVCEKRKAAVSNRYKGEKDANATNEYKCTEMNTSASDNDSDSECDSEHNSLLESMCVDAHESTSEDRKLAAPCGFFQNVYLTADEFKKLEAEYGEQKLKKAITLLSARIQKDGKYKDDNHAALIVQWVMKAVEEDEVKELELKSRKKKARGSPEQQSEKLEKAKKAGFDFEFEDIYEKP
jgi:hypothetical protein